MERAVNMLGLKGFIVNSHTHDLYLDDPRFAPILEAAQALDRAVAGMIEWRIARF